MVDYEKLTALEKITRCKVQLGYNKPFWAYLINHLKVREPHKAETESAPCETIAVDNKGNLIYWSAFINKLSEAELTGVLAHEVGHVAFKHLDRLADFKKEERNALAWNISADAVINLILLKDGFTLPAGIIPDVREDNFVFNGKVIEDLSNKSVEMVYREIKPKTKKENQQKGFDEHRHNDEKEDKNKTDDGIGKETAEEKWGRVLVEASTHARNSGKIPKGVERLIGDLLNPEVSWKEKLYKYITNEIPSDYTYSRPSKKSMGCGIYLPSAKKENLDIVVGIDVSGSIRQKEYDKFISEMISLAKSHSNVKVRLMTWDTKVNADLEFRNGDIQKIREVSLVGGGGTDINPFFEKINKEYPTTRIAVVFTDGYLNDEITERINGRVLWVLTSDGKENYVDDYGGDIVRLEDN